MVSARALLWVAASGVLCGAGACTRQEHGLMHAHQPKSELGAYAAFDAQDVLWAVTAEGGHVLVQRSADAGATWGKAQRVNAEAEAIGTGGDSRPKIATGTDGELYVSWTRPFSKPYTGEIRFSRSLDRPISGSVDWSTLETPFFLQKGQRPERIKLNVVVDGRGTLWIDDITLWKGPLT